MICRVNEEEEEREPRGEMMNEPLSAPLPPSRFIQKYRSCLPLIFFFFSVLRWGTINWLGNFLSNVHTVRKLFVEFSVLYWSGKLYLWKYFCFICLEW